MNALTHYINLDFSGFLVGFISSGFIMYEQRFSP